MLSLASHKQSVQAFGSPRPPAITQGNSKLWDFGTSALYVLSAKCAHWHSLLDTALQDGRETESKSVTRSHWFEVSHIYIIIIIFIFWGAI